ncbi:MAG: PIN domain-containing protein [Planctomycetota bacterium]
MDRAILDTDAFSFFFKKDTRRELYADDVRDRQLCLSFQTYAELKLWTIERKWKAKRIEQLLQVLKHYQIVPYDSAVGDCWAQIMAHRRSIGQEILSGDCWIAAAAVRHGIRLLTHNGDHFRNIPGLDVTTHVT